MKLLSFVGLVSVLMSISTSAEARGSSGGGFLSGLLVLVAIGLVVMIAYRFLSADQDWRQLPADFEEWFVLGLIGFVSILIGGWFWLFGYILWLTATGKFPIISSIVGLACFGAICFFVAKVVLKSISRNRKWNLARRLADKSRQQKPNG